MLGRGAGVRPTAAQREERSWVMKLRVEEEEVGVRVEPPLRVQAKYVGAVPALTMALARLRLLERGATA